MPNIIETADAAANTSTIYSLTSGQTAQGALSSGSDHDWYRVDLVAGQTYSFAVVGTGSNNVQDPTLRLALPGGSTFVTPTANGLPGSNEVLTYTATATGSYYIDAGGTGAGQYGVAFTTGNRPSFDTQMGRRHGRGPIRRRLHHGQPPLIRYPDGWWRHRHRFVL